MIRNLFCYATLLALVLGTLAAINPLIADEPLPPDVVVLNSGGQLEGQVSELKIGNRTIVEIKQSNGSTIQVAKDLVKFVRRPKEAYAEYLAKKSQTADTVDAHWEMSQWCRDNLDSRLSNGPSSLGPERRYHLEAILKLDPDHKQARAFLGYSLEKGGWVNLEQQRLGHGFVRYKKRWMTPAEIAMEEAEQSWKDQQTIWTRRLKKLRSGKGLDPTTIAEIGKIDDPAAIDPLIELAATEASDDWMLMYIEALGNIHSPQAARALCDIGAKHASPEVRERCVSRLKQKNVDQRAAAQYLSNRYLRSDNNEWVNRAGFMIGEIGELSQVEALIDALVTQHIVPNPRAKSPGAISSTFSNQGTGISPGSGESKLLKLTQKNASVVDALRRLTKANFEFDEPRWKDWFAQQHTLIDVQVSRDD